MFSRLTIFSAFCFQRFRFFLMLTLPDFGRTLAPSLTTGFNMSYLERAITDGHAKLTGEGKQQAVPAPNGGQRDFSLSASTEIPRSRERERMSAGQVRVVGEKQFNTERAGVRCRSLQLAERKKPYTVIECKADGVTDAEFNQ